MKKSIFFSLLAISLFPAGLNAAGGAGQDSTENVVQADTLLRLTAADSTALEQIKALLKDGQYAEAEAQARELLANVEAEHGAKSLEAATVLDQLVESLRRGGKAAEPEIKELAERALAIKAKALGPEHPELAKSLNSIGAIFYFRGRYKETEQLWKRSLAIREKALALEHPYVAASLNNLAALYSGQSKYAEAEPLLKRALAIDEEAFGPEHPRVAFALGHLVGLFEAQGKHGETEPLIRRSLAIQEKVLGPDHQVVAWSLSALADLFLLVGRQNEAEPLYERALAIWEKALGTESSTVGYGVCDLANLYSRQGKFDEAEPLFKRALAIVEESLGLDHPHVAWVLEYYSEHYRRQENGTRALRLAKRAIGIRREHFDNNVTVLTEKDAISFSRSLRKSVDGYLSCYVEVEMNDRQTINTVADIVLSGKGHVSDGIFRRRGSLVRLLAGAETLRLAKFQLSQLYVEGPGEDATAYRTKMDSLSRHAAELEADLARNNSSYRRQQDYKDVSAERIAWLLPRQSAVVEYLKYDFQQLNPDSSIPHYLVLVLDADVEPIIVDLGEASEIEPLVEQYRRHLLSVSSSGRMPNIVDFEHYRKVSEELYEKVWRPISQHLSDKELVFVAADGALNLLSFAGLMDGDGKYLIEKTPIHYLSSGRDLMRLKDQAETAAGLFALGDPDYGASASARLREPETPEDTVSEPVYYATRNVRSGCGTLKDITVDPLPGTRKEVEWIAAGWKESTDEPAAFYFGSDASEERFKAEAWGNRVIHLATHGYFLEGVCQPDIPKRGFGDDVGFVGENPLLLSGLFLAGANLHGDDADSLGAEDGILTAEEVSEMVLDGTDLVVLSACETGLGEVKEGEGVYGLRRAFQMAGARTVISALWPISDKETAEMMSQLYDKRGESLPQTIRKIQLRKINELRAQNKVDHPFSWGGFFRSGRLEVIL